MKKLITFSAVCFITAILFSSCSSNLSIAKRHFNNGYYIAYSNGKQPVHVPKEENKEVQSQTREPFYYVQNKTEQNTIVGYSDQSSIAGTNDIVASNEKLKHKTISQLVTKQVSRQKIKIIEDPTLQIKSTLFKTKNVNGDPSDNDGLSLFWIVILLVLVLWALGFWGFGLVSGLINLLLLIALILLILWLLRVV